MLKKSQNRFGEGGDKITLRLGMHMWGLYIVGGQGSPVRVLLDVVVGGRAIK